MTKKDLRLRYNNILQIPIQLTPDKQALTSYMSENSRPHRHRRDRAQRSALRCLFVQIRLLDDDEAEPGVPLSVHPSPSLPDDDEFRAFLTLPRIRAPVPLKRSTLSPCNICINSSSKGIETCHQKDHMPNVYCRSFLLGSK